VLVEITHMMGKLARMLLVVAVVVSLTRVEMALAGMLVELAEMALRQALQGHQFIMLAVVELMVLMVLALADLVVAVLEIVYQRQMATQELQTLAVVVAGIDRPTTVARVVLV
jgi:hypothetical protein